MRMKMTTAGLLALGAGLAAVPVLGLGQPATAAPIEVAPGETQSYMLVQNGVTWAVRVTVDDTTVTRNGEEVEGARLERQASDVVVLSEEGEELLRLGTLSFPVADDLPPLPQARQEGDATQGSRTQPRSPKLEELRPFGTGTVQAPLRLQLRTPAQAENRPQIGVLMQELPDVLQHHLDIDQGVLVAEVTPGFPAAEAGLQQNDVIVGIDGERGVTPERLREAVSSAKPGEALQLEVRRGSDRLTIEVTPQQPGQGSGAGAGLPEDVSSALDEMENALDKVLARVQDEELADEAREAYRQLREEIRGMREQLGRGFGGAGSGLSGVPGGITIWRNGDVTAMPAPFAQGFGNGFGGPWLEQLLNDPSMNGLMGLQMPEMQAQLEEQAQRMAEEVERMAREVMRRQNAGAGGVQGATPGVQSETERELEEKIDRYLEQQRTQPSEDAGTGA